MSDTEWRVQIERLQFAWPGTPTLLAIDEFSLGAGERLFLRGPSGSGKSTLLGLIAGVLTPQAGQILVCGAQMSALRGTQRDQLRADRLGVISGLKSQSSDAAAEMLQWMRDDGSAA